MWIYSYLINVKRRKRIDQFKIKPNSTITQNVVFVKFGNEWMITTKIAQKS